MTDKKTTVKDDVKKTVTPATVAPNEHTEKYTAHFKTVSMDSIPKSTRTKTGEYSEILEALKTLPENNALSFDVPKRTTANGIQKYFKAEGFTVTTRRNKDSKDGQVTVFISKTVKP
jgi:hypothetical protein